MNGHFVNPSVESSSLGLLLSTIDCVPIGDVRNSSMLPENIYVVLIKMVLGKVLVECG